MFGKARIGGVDVRVIFARVDHSGFEFVWNKDIGHPAEVLEGLNMGSDVESEIMGGGGFGVSIAVGAKGGDKDLSLGTFSRSRDLLQLNDDEIFNKNISSLIILNKKIEKLDIL